MSEEASYVTVDDNGDITIEVDGHINTDNLDMFQFSFADGIDITESVEKKNVKNKIPVSFTKKGRTAYTPITVTYPDGGSTSSKFLLEGCILQHTPALNAQNHTYAKEFIFCGIPGEYIDKIIKDGKDNSQINLQNKTNVQYLNGHYWQRCNLDKLSHKDTMVVTEDAQTVKISIDALLKESKKSVVANIVFTLSGSMRNENMEEELDLKDGVYTITMKPTAVYMINETEIKGPELTDTNNRKKEGVSISRAFAATGNIAVIAARRLKGGRK